MDQKVLVLGSTGMLGSMVTRYLKEIGFNVQGSSRDKNGFYFDAEAFINNPEEFLSLRDFDYIVNCIGIIKSHINEANNTGVEAAIKINAWLPHQLSEWVKGSDTKIIQIATDCVYDGEKGGYSEADPHDPLDVYGKTKSLGEVRGQDHFLNIRCSIIGPELKTHSSLLDWFLHHPEGAVLQGYDHHHWNGVTTLQFARLVEKIISADKFNELTAVSPVHHFVPNNQVTKYELLNLFKEAFGKDITIERVDNIGPAIDRTLGTKFSELEKLMPSTTMKQAVEELAEYIGKYQK